MYRAVVVIRGVGGGDGDGGGAGSAHLIGDGVGGMAVREQIGVLVREQVNVKGDNCACLTLWRGIFHITRIVGNHNIYATSHAWFSGRLHESLYCKFSSMHTLCILHLQQIW